ncbi:PepSY domain-containing protein [Sphingomonas sp.]|uniref:PepSY domain-containing protein n=1 Tax=Sphingomonas sp. TaxID=28214 RepID=UPI00286DECB7|nr:PepSY domain-containing protein [Sphingomonas sp.]
MSAMRSRLRRWHVWLGWLVGLPILLWIATGVLMVARPIEAVRGTHLMREPTPMRLATPPAMPALEGVPLTSLMLERRAAGPRWVVTLADGTTRLADPASGKVLPPLSAADAVREVSVLYMGQAQVREVIRTDPAKPPLELRRPIAAWRVAMDDGTRFYVDAGSGAVVAKRTGWWRFYDLMWGLHIMDLRTREDAHNPLTIGFGVGSLVMALLALVLLPMTNKRKRKREAKPIPK